MTRVVRCPHCLSVVRAQVNKRSRCPSCGGYFFVPNSARATLAPRRSVSSIPRLPRYLPARPGTTWARGRGGNQRSREEVARVRGEVGYGLILQRSLASTRRGKAWSAKESDHAVGRREYERGTIGEPSLYPKDPKWEIIDGNPDYQLIIDFPYHRDQEIAVETEDGILAIRSLKEDAPPRYQIEFALPPEVVEESLNWVFNNGALILHFDKKKG